MTPRRRRRTPRVCAAAAAAVAGAWAWGGLPAGAATGSEPVDARSLTDEQVRAAARAIVEELYRRQDPELFWDPPLWDPDRHGQRSQVGGYTPLAVLALLYAGESYQDPRLRDAVRHLESAQLRGTYAVAVRAHVWAQLPQRFRKHLLGDTKWLIGAFQDSVGGWGYEQKPRSRWFDNSLAQYGALGLWEAAKRGVPVTERYWARLERRFLENQYDDGGWNYRGRQPVTGSMTAAGLTALFITQDFLHARDALDINAAPASPGEAAIARGLQWMDRHFSATENPGNDAYLFYYLYGVERVGLASGYKTFGGRDWFREGAAEIIDRLCSRDADTGATMVRARFRSRASPTQTRQLAFGLMFLSRGRVPVAVNKLMANGVAWNNRPRDAANLTRWLSGETETQLSWQIVGLDGVPQEWLDAPLLYLASHEALPWSPPGGGPRNRRGAPAEPLPEDLAKLKRYLDLGGLLLAVNEGRSAAFARSVEQAGARMYPQYSWRALPSDHWAYTLLWPVRARRPALRALSNGVRELIILCPERDLSAAFQVRRDDPAAFGTAGNIYLYASEMNRPRPRLARHFTGDAPGTQEPSAGGRVAATVVRASYDGNWNPEPAALAAFAANVAEQRRLDVRIGESPLRSIDSLAPRPDLVIVSGTEAHDFSATERSAIRAYVEAGGVILFETAGGRGAFADAAQRALGELFEDGAAPPRAVAESRIVTGEGLPGAPNLRRLEYRPYALEVFGARETAPRLTGMTIGGRARVLFSREDISHGLLDQPCWGIAGYAAASARDLLGNIVHHAAAD